MTPSLNQCPECLCVRRLEDLEEFSGLRHEMNYCKKDVFSPSIRLFRYYTLWCNASCHFRTWRGQNFLWDECPRKTVTELEELITPVLHLSISTPRVYLWSFLNPITNPQKQLYKKKSLLGPGLLHNIIHIWRGRDFMSRQQEPTHPGGLP